MGFALLGSQQAGAASEDAPWFGRNAQGDPQIELYFFWSRTCPHCAHARPFVASLAARYPWLHVHSLQLQGEPDNVQRYLEMAEALGQDASSVPAFLFCDEMLVGFGSAADTGAQLDGRLNACYRRQRDFLPNPAPAPAPTAPTTLSLPGLGEVDASAWSLPMLTLVLAGFDAFNPCAFFVLLFLLSLLVHLRSRRRMAVVGGLFVFCSGLVYFLFMAAWLNVFLWLGELRAVTVAAGLLAVGMALLNVKDFARPGEGPSLSLSGEAKNRFYERVRALIAAGEWPAMLTATVALAVAVNGYELLCTAGFPMLYTRILTLEALSPAGYYLYLGLYNVVYVLPLLAIVTAFTATLGKRKLSAREGRLLKLLSGLMMGGLGTVLLAAPEALTDPRLAITVLGGAVVLTLLIGRLLPPVTPARE